MGKKSSKKIDILSIVIFAVLVVALALTIVGICIDWMTTTTEIFGSTTNSTTLSKLLDAQKQYVSDYGGEPNAALNTNAAFSIMTIIFTGLTALAFAAKLFSKNKIVKFLTLIFAGLTIVCAVVAIGTLYSYISGTLISDSSTAGAGAWLLFVFGIVGGAAGAVGAFKK